MTTDRSWTSQYVEALGVDRRREPVLFAALLDALASGLPQAWSQQADALQRVYFWNELSGDSTWTHPDYDIHVALISWHHAATSKKDAAGFLRGILQSFESELNTAARNWSGPYHTPEGVPYWHDAIQGVSAWQDPMAELARCHTMKSKVVAALMRSALGQVSSSLPSDGAAVCIQRVARGWLARRRLQRRQRHAKRLRLDSRGMAATTSIGSTSTVDATGSGVASVTLVTDPRIAQLEREVMALKNAWTQNVAATPAEQPAPAAKPVRRQLREVETPVHEKEAPASPVFEGSSNLPTSRQELSRPNTRSRDMRRQLQLERLRQSGAAKRVQRTWRSFTSLRAQRKLAEDARIARDVSSWRSRRTAAATKLQAAWRRYKVRRRVAMTAQAMLHKKRYAIWTARRNGAAVHIQKIWKGISTRRGVNAKRRRQKKAAAAIADLKTERHPPAVHLRVVDSPAVQSPAVVTKQFETDDRFALAPSPVASPPVDEERSAGKTGGGCQVNAEWSAMPTKDSISGRKQPLRLESRGRDAPRTPYGEPEAEPGLMMSRRMSEMSFLGRSDSSDSKFGIKEPHGKDVRRHQDVKAAPQKQNKVGDKKPAADPQQFLLDLLGKDCAGQAKTATDGSTERTPPLRADKQERLEDVFVPVGKSGRDLERSKSWAAACAKSSALSQRLAQSMPTKPDVASELKVPQKQATAPSRPSSSSFIAEDSKPLPPPSPSGIVGRRRSRGDMDSTPSQAAGDGGGLAGGERPRRQRRSTGDMPMESLPTPTSKSKALLFPAEEDALSKLAALDASTPRRQRSVARSSSTPGLGGFGSHVSRDANSSHWESKLSFLESHQWEYPADAAAFQRPPTAAEPGTPPGQAGTGQGWRGRRAPLRCAGSHLAVTRSSACFPRGE
eukprot:TRINITY_DN9484_c0_g1_i4.p1 TRINITY_DN9484_c0_g1~~TRINITY_DN9484_c0_g1_i4.p1  ORF type:complete len:899 (+),score=195.76 TRINITY_DN9484_c0_g1_i4:260-2956(+)